MLFRGWSAELYVILYLRGRSTSLIVENYKMSLTMLSPLMYSARKLTRVYRNLLKTHFNCTQGVETFWFIPFSSVVYNFSNSPLSHEQFLLMEQSKVFNHKGNVKLKVMQCLCTSWFQVPFFFCRYWWWPIDNYDNRIHCEVIL